jgi:hypothetical protein
MIRKRPLEVTVSVLVLTLLDHRVSLLNAGKTGAICKLMLADISQEILNYEIRQVFVVKNFLNILRDDGNAAHKLWNEVWNQGLQNDLHQFQGWCIFHLILDVQQLLLKRDEGLLAFDQLHLILFGIRYGRKTGIRSFLSLFIPKVLAAFAGLVVFLDLGEFLECE